MKRIIVALLILIISALAAVMYNFTFPNIGILKNIYASFDAFGLWLQGFIPGLKQFSEKQSFLVFWFICTLVIILVILFISSIIVSKKKKAIDKEKNKEEEKKENGVIPSQQFKLVSSKGYEQINGQNIPYSTFVQVSNSMSEEEKDKEFVWQNFVDKKHPIRKIILWLLVFFTSLYLIFRFFWLFRDSDGWVGNSFAQGVLNTSFMNWLMTSVDSASNFVFQGFLPDKNDPSMFCLVSNFFNNQNLYINQLVEFICTIVVVYCIGVAYFLLAALTYKIFAKSIGTKKALKARTEYEEDVENGRDPKYKKQGNTYIINYYYNGDIKPGNYENSVTPINGENFVGDLEYKEFSTDDEKAPKAELVMGGANFSGDNVSSIAEIDSLEDKKEKEASEKKVDYIEDISEGVEDVDQIDEKPYEEYENVTEVDDENSTIANEEGLDENGKANTIFESISDDQEINNVEETDKIIGFDENGFATKESEPINSDEEIPQVIKTTDALENIKEEDEDVSVIEEPSLKLLDNIVPIETQSNVSGKINSIVDLSSYKEKKIIVDSNYKLEDNAIKSLEKFNPKVVPVEHLLEETALNNGEFIFTEDSDVQFVSSEVSDNKSEEEQIPEVKIIKEEEVEQEPVKPVIPEGLKPVHDIKKRETPRIVPLKVKKTIDESPIVENVPVITPLAGPVHEITKRSKKKDIKPVAINKDYRFALKRFETSTYKGSLTPEEAFKLGAIKVTPVISPLSDSAVDDAKVPSWMKKVKERNAKQNGITNSKFKQAEELKSIWDVNTKKDVLSKVNDVSLKRHRKDNQGVKETKPIKPISNNIAKPIVPISIKTKENVEPQKIENIEVKIIKPLAPVHKINERKDIKPIKPQN